MKAWSLFKKSVDSLLSLFIRPQALILQEWPGQATRPTGPSQPRRLCLFAHFDRNNQVSPYVIYYLEQLKNLGGMEIVFVTTSAQFPLSEVAKVSPFCSRVIHRKNLALDFGSWRVALLGEKNLNQFDQLILANDSVYGPLSSLQKLFSTMESKNLDLWGITSNREYGFYHIQSYFLVMSSRVIQSEAFLSFWNHFRYYRSKFRTITEYEMGLTRLAQKCGWKVGAYIEHTQVSETDLNPTLSYWDTLIERFNCPILKTEVLRLNRTRSPRVPNWREVIREHTSYDPALIEEDLKRYSTLRDGYAKVKTIP